MTPAEFLRRARARIEKPENWTKGAYAVNSLGLPCETNNEDAQRWCSSGTLSCEVQFIRWPADIFNNWHDIFLTARAALYDVMGGSLLSFNDSHSHAEVLAAFDQAIEKLS